MIALLGIPPAAVYCQHLSYFGIVKQSSDATSGVLSGRLSEATCPDNRLAGLQTPKKLSRMNWSSRANDSGLGRSAVFDDLIEVSSMC